MIVPIFNKKEAMILNRFEFFSKIDKKYNLEIDKKKVICIRADGKGITSNKKINLLRYFIGLIVLGSLYSVIHIINHLEFIEQYSWLLKTSNLVTHFGLAIVAIYLVPLLFKKLPFLKDK